MEVYAEPGDEYELLFIAKGGGSANKTFLYQETKALLNPESLFAFAEEKMRSIGTSACPPYHIALVVGGPSAEFTLKTDKLASTHYLDNRPMPEILAELRQYPVATRLSLSGPMIVARDIAHAKLKERVDRGEGLPQYFRDHMIYYAGPAKRPEGRPSGSFGPTTAGRMDSYVDLFQSPGGSMVMLAKGNRSRQVRARCARRAAGTAASTSARSAAPPPGSPTTASRRSTCTSTPSWAWRRSGASRSRTSPPSSSSTTRGTTSTPS